MACATPTHCANFDEAAKMRDQARRKPGVVRTIPVGSLYEKGLSVKKNMISRSACLPAGRERGNAKAMRDPRRARRRRQGRRLQERGATFKAADRGLGGEATNLGILYARGIGVEQNFSRSFKSLWRRRGQRELGASTRRYRQAARCPVARRRPISRSRPSRQNRSPTTPSTSQAGGWDSAPPQTGTPPRQASSSKRAAIIDGKGDAAQASPPCLPRYK